MEVESKHFINTPHYSEEELEAAKRAWLLKHERDAARFLGPLPDSKSRVPPTQETENETKARESGGSSLFDLLKVIAAITIPAAAQQGRPELPPPTPPERQPQQPRDRFDNNNLDFDDGNEDRSDKKNRQFIETASATDKTILNKVSTIRNVAQAIRIKKHIDEVDKSLLRYIERDPNAQTAWDTYRKENGLGNISSFDYKQELRNLNNLVLLPSDDLSAPRNFTFVEPIKKSRLAREIEDFEKENESWMRRMMKQMWSWSESLFSFRPYEEKIEPIKIENENGVVDLSENMNNQIVTNNTVILGPREDASLQVVKPPTTATTTELTTTTDTTTPIGEETGVIPWQPPTTSADDKPVGEVEEKPTAEDVGVAKPPSAPAKPSLIQIYMKSPNTSQLKETFEQRPEMPTFKTPTSEVLDENVPTKAVDSKVAMSNDLISLMPNANDYGPLDTKIRSAASELEELSKSDKLGKKVATEYVLNFGVDNVYNNTVKAIGEIGRVFNFMQGVTAPIQVVEDLVLNYRAKPQYSSNPDIQLLEESLRQPSVNEKKENVGKWCVYLIAKTIGNYFIRNMIMDYVYRKIGYDRSLIPQERSRLRNEIRENQGRENQLLETSMRLKDNVIGQNVDELRNYLENHPFSDKKQDSFLKNTIKENLEILSNNVNLDSDLKDRYSVFNLKQGKSRPLLSTYLAEKFPGVELRNLIQYQKEKKIKPMGLKAANDALLKATELSVTNHELERTRKNIAAVRGNLQQLEPSWFSKTLGKINNFLWYYEAANTAYQIAREIIPTMYYDRSYDINKAILTLEEKHIQSDKRTRQALDEFMLDNLSPEGYSQYQAFVNELRNKAKASASTNKADMPTEIAALNGVYSKANVAASSDLIETIKSGKEFSMQELTNQLAFLTLTLESTIRSKTPNYANQPYDRLIDSALDKEDQNQLTDESENIEKAVNILVETDPKVKEVLGDLTVESISTMSESDLKTRIMNIATFGGALSDVNMRKLSDLASANPDLSSFLSSLLKVGTENGWWSESPQIVLALTFIKIASLGVGVAASIKKSFSLYRGSGRTKGCQLCGNPESLLVHDKNPTDITCRKCFNSRNATSKNFNKRTTKLFPIEQSNVPEHKQYLNELRKMKMEAKLKHVKIPTRHDEFFEGAGIDEKFKKRATSGYLGERSFMPKTDYKNMAMLMGENDHGELNEVGRMNLSGLITKCLAHNKDKIKGPINLEKLNHFNSLADELEKNPKLLEHYTV